MSFLYRNTYTGFGTEESIAMGDETQYLLRVEMTLLAEQIGAAIERASGLRMCAVERSDQQSLKRVLELEHSLRLFRRRLRKLNAPEGLTGQPEGISRSGYAAHRGSAALSGD